MEKIINDLKHLANSWRVHATLPESSDACKIWLELAAKQLLDVTEHHETKPE